MRKIWEEYPEVLQILWENLSAHQKQHKWPSRTMSLADMVDGLLGDWEKLAAAQRDVEFYAVYMTNYDDEWHLEYVSRTQEAAKARVKSRVPTGYDLHWVQKVIEGTVCQYAVGYYDEKYRVEVYTI